MPDWLAQHEPVLRLAIFAVLFAAFAAWELLLPRRWLRDSKPHRWFTNLGVFALDVALVRVLFPLSAVGFAELAQRYELGLLQLIALPGWLQVFCAVVLLDLVIYWQHRLFHKVPVLWRLHKVHHADLDIDMTTGIRFHPLEILLSMLIKLLAVLLIGAPALAIVLFEVVLNGTALFNHANIFIRPGVDRILRLVVVTPDMHRVHHSSNFTETNSNYGFNLPWWDRLFASYRAQPQAGHTDMHIGLRGIPERQTLARLLLLPFRPRGQQPVTSQV
ncbi:MAG: sterol desaturase family protein [Gammaproteobacteria bacterium]|nr:sterol desaturase family protein [Gammaproteobacteria bacterium]